MVQVSSKNIQRWLAVGLLVLVVLLVGSAIMIPVISKSLALRETKDNLALRLRQYERILSQKESVVASMDEIKQQHDEQNYFNNQKTEALASAEIQELIKKAVVDAGGQLSSTQSIPAEVQDGFNRIVVRVRMTGNSETLRAVLYKIETSTPFIIIDQIDIRPMRGRRNNVTRQIDPSNDLNINFQAVSFMRKPAA